MSKTQKILLGIFLTVIVAVIILTWGSVGSATLTLGLLLGGIFLAMKKSMDRENDFEMED